MSQHQIPPKRLVLVADHYSDHVCITDERGFEILESSSMPILLGYDKKLGIPHWADRPGESYIELTDQQQKEIASRAVACWNACEGIPTEALEQVVITYQSIYEMASACSQMLEALKLADAMLSGANMNAKVVQAKVQAAIAKIEGTKGGAG